jgi:hypothetical protein
MLQFYLKIKINLNLRLNAFGLIQKKYCFFKKIKKEINFLFSVDLSSLAVTERILVSFFFCAALTNMLKFSAYPRFS